MAEIVFTDTDEHEVEIFFPFAGDQIAVLAIVTDIGVEAEIEEGGRGNALEYGTSWTSARITVRDGFTAHPLWEGDISPKDLNISEITDAELYDAISEIAEESFREHYRS